LATNPKNKKLTSTKKVANALERKPESKATKAAKTKQNLPVKHAIQVPVAKVVAAAKKTKSSAPKPIKPEVATKTTTPKTTTPKTIARKTTTTKVSATKVATLKTSSQPKKISKDLKSQSTKKTSPKLIPPATKSIQPVKSAKKVAPASMIKPKTPMASVPVTDKAKLDIQKTKQASAALKGKTTIVAAGVTTGSSKKMGTLASQAKPAPAPIDNGPPTDPKILAKIRGMQSIKEKRKDFAQLPTAKPVLIHSSKLFAEAKDPEKDRLILMVRDPYWLHACWDITRKSVERAKAALAGHWHAARPVLRLLRTEDNSTTSNSESVFRDVPIHGGVRNWYIDVEDPQTTFRILLGYLFANGRFHELARSNPVTTPVPGSADATDDNWADIATDAERIYALSGGYDEESTQVELQQMMQEKLKRPVGTPAMSQFGSGAEGSLKRSKNFHFTLDAEMVVFGSTPANAYVTLNGEPIKIRSDGTYSARVPLPNNRQVMAATSKSRDGLDEQTIVIAVERNTKIMEPLSLTEPDLE